MVQGWPLLGADPARSGGIKIPTVLTAQIGARPPPYQRDRYRHGISDRLALPLSATPPARHALTQLLGGARLQLMADRRTDAPYRVTGADDRPHGDRQGLIDLADLLTPDLPVG